MQNKLVLLREACAIDERLLDERPLEIGSASSCDVVIDDPGVPPRAYLVQPRGGTVWLFDLSAPKLPGRVLGLERPLALGARHTLVRTQIPAAKVASAAAHARDAPRGTTPIEALEPPCGRRWSVLVGRGADARRVSVGERPLAVGKARDNDLVLSDPTVSAAHCRFEVTGSTLTVRDLDSTNGTFVQGVRVARAEVAAGAQVRVGRTDLHVLAWSERTAGGAPAMVASSGAMHEVVADVRRFAQLSWPLLVLGPSGVGKEELAGLVHRESAGRRGPLVALNAGGLPRELVESELFGHERGAFTGAHAQRRGVFEQAHGGTLFLDEIGELPLALQSRLLRVLETWQIRRVGAESDVAVDVRLVCATHRDLPRMVQEGRFRQDLYYRLARLVVSVPPLVERTADIVPLARHFLAQLAAELGTRGLSRAAEARLLAHGWPGNARELRNVLGAAAALSGAQVLEAEDIERALRRVSGPLAEGTVDADAIERAVVRYGGNLSAVSRALAIPRSTLRDRLRRGPRAPDASDEGG